jgi:hypothetical protein
MHNNKVFPYLINLDPAAGIVPFPANIDIRDTVFSLLSNISKYDQS